MENNIWSEIKIVADEAEHVSKYVFSKSDAVAEAVLYAYPDFKTRTVICCSTQSGCPVECRFCGAGDNFVRIVYVTESEQKTSVRRRVAKLNMLQAVAALEISKHDLIDEP